MVAAEPSVPRHFHCSVVALEVAVVELVKVNAHFHLWVFVHHKIFKSGVAENGVRRLHIPVEQDVKRVAGDNQVDRKVGVEQQVFDRVHRDARPWADIDVSVVKGMGQLVERRPMKRAVDPVKMKAGPDRDEHKERDKPDRVVREQHRWGIAICHRPKDKNLGGGPQRYPAGNMPEHVVQHLIVESESPVVARLIPRVEFCRITLTFADNQPIMQKSGAEALGDKIDQPNLNDPAELERLHGL